MNILGLISQLIGIKTLRLTLWTKANTEPTSLLDSKSDCGSKFSLKGTRPSIEHNYLSPSNKLATIF